MSTDRMEAVRGIMEAFNRGQATRESLDAFLAEDAVWHFGGASPLAGDYRGRDDIYTFLTALSAKTRGTAHVESIDLLDGDHYAMSFTRFRADRDGGQLELLFADATRWDEDGRLAEYWSLVNDQDTLDALLS